MWFILETILPVPKFFLIPSPPCLKILQPSICGCYSCLPLNHTSVMAIMSDFHIATLTYLPYPRYVSHVASCFEDSKPHYIYKVPHWNATCRHMVHVPGIEIRLGSFFATSTEKGGLNGYRLCCKYSTTQRIKVLCLCTLIHFTYIPILNTL